MNEIKTGKVIYVNIGDYPLINQMVGVMIAFQGVGWRSMDFWGAWWPVRREDWVSEDEMARYAQNSIDELRRIARRYGVDDPTKLVGLPVEVEFTHYGRVVNWRILTETGSGWAH